MYILPLAQHSYLFEWTRFSREPGEHEEITAQLMQWLATNTGTGNSLGRRECGSLPMAPCMVKADPGSRIITAGTAGGSMRAATGYAFHAIQRWADQCQASLVAGGPPVAPKQNQLLNFMDEVFLRALQQNSAFSESILCALFSRTEPDALIRFLTGLPRSSDLWSVIQSLPWLPFIKATFACIAGGRES
jgi:lycopene beta-cyclase